MNKPTRLFDCIEYQVQAFGEKTMFAAKEGGQWRKYSTTEVKATANKFSAGLLQLGVGANDSTDEGCDKIAIISNNRPEWLLTDFAVQQTGAVLVPIYPTTNPNELQFILSDAQVKYIFVSNRELYDKVKSISGFVTSLKNIYSFDKLEGVDHWTDVLDMASPTKIAELAEIKANISETHLATIIYTSGTTGTPKGVMLTHKNICTNIQGTIKSFPFNDRPDYKSLSFLPLNHIFEKNVVYLFMTVGVQIYFAESLETIGDNLKEIKPDVFTTVPRLLEKVYEKIMAKGMELEGIKRKLFFWAVGLAQRYDTVKSGGAFYTIQLALANKIIFTKWREALGGNIKAVVTGGAACQEKLLRTFNGAGIPVFEGYGPTENSPVICLNRMEPGGNVLGTVGPTIEGVEIKLEADGEICVRGTSVMKGYYKRPDLTAETIINGWLHTGDIGTWVNDRFLKITDRKKELFKTSGGKYVAPQPIENRLKASAFIEQVIVVGPERKFVGALIVPSFSNLKAWMHHHHMDELSNEELIHHPKVLEKYKHIVEEMNQQINHVEQIKKFELLPREWSIESGEMTPKMSLKRKIIMEKYKDAIERIYA
jgi:long-chain acyl-CoA synthetase